MLFSSPGTPYIYYGEEIGLTQGGTGHDVYKRAPMQWNNSNQAGFTQAKTSWVEQAELFGDNYTQWWPEYLAQQINAADRNVKTQQAQPDSLWRLYQHLIALKKQRRELGIKGSYELTQHNNGLVEITRELNGSKSIFVLNLTANPQSISSIKRDGLTPSWQHDLNGEQLAGYGLVLLNNTL